MNKLLPLYLGLFLVSTKTQAQSTPDGFTFVYLAGQNGQPADAFPLPLCAGDCDTDSDCADGLKCHLRGPGEIVPGCLGGDSDGSETDFCVAMDTPRPTLRPSISPSPSSRPSNSQQPSSSAAPSILTTIPPTLAPNRLELVRAEDSEIPANAAPLQHCQGDCNSDADCAEGLTCFSRTAGGETRAWGCEGVGGSGLPDLDVCLRPVDMPTTSPPTIAPTYPPNQLLQSDTFPLQHCKGDCDTDSDCADDLICWARTAGGETRAWGCAGVGGSGLADLDVCLDPMDMPTSMPTTEPTMAPTYPLNQLLVSNAFPLQHCKGDCDTDSDCADGLVCWARSTGGETRAWGCAGVGGSGLADLDVCLNPLDMPTSPPTNAPTTAPTYPFVEVPRGSFKLKLHWEPGFFWQEEDDETFWCISYNYDRSYCWYGDDESDCFMNEMYLDTCGSRYEQEFYFIDLNNGGEVLIALDDGSNRCWERDRRRVFTTRCDESNPMQVWIAQNGAFADPTFEITQRGFGQQCVTNDHHPKEREGIEMHTTAFSRGPESRTSLWVKY